MAELYVSYPIFIGGAVLQCFSLFMLSLARPGSYYQVCSCPITASVFLTRYRYSSLKELALALRKG